MAHFIPEIIEEFAARTSRGRKVIIRKYHPCTCPTEEDAPDEIIPERLYLLTSEGEKVTDKGNGIYRIEDGPIVRR